MVSATVNDLCIWNSEAVYESVGGALSAGVEVAYSVCCYAKVCAYDAVEESVGSVDDACVSLDDVGAEAEVKVSVCSSAKGSSGVCV